MSRGRAKGENEITREVKRRCQRSGEDPCEVLAEMLRKANAAGDTDLIAKIKEAQKYMGCRNVWKRESDS
jgi:hypothetical protein